MTTTPPPTTTPSTARTSSHQYSIEDGITYQHGFSNHFESEALPNTLPHHRNNPKNVPYNLYTEQLSGSAFTSPRNTNFRSWLYRIRPSVSSTILPLKPCGTGGDYPRHFGYCDWNKDWNLDPNAMRWGPMPHNTINHSKTNQQQNNNNTGGGVNFVQGLHTMAGSGDPKLKHGLAIYTYTFDHDMTNVHMYNSDGDFLIVPQMGTLYILTEFGKLIVHPTEICILPRGIVFSIHRYRRRKQDKEEDSLLFCRGYILEIFKGHFVLPELGPIGSNGLANVRDFCYPTAWFEPPNNNNNNNNTSPSTTTTTTAHIMLCKFGNQLFHRTISHSPYNVVAWHGNYAPFKYNLNHFCAVGSVTYDHLDPSIYTVLTAKSNDEEGTALADFVIFPPRILASDENTFRPPWFHRNCMAEYMGLICGEYDAKASNNHHQNNNNNNNNSGGGGGFVPGGCSLHNIMTPHGPDRMSYQKAMNMDCSKPTKFDGGLAFMFETCCFLQVSNYALMCSHRELNYAAHCWDGFQDEFFTAAAQLVGNQEQEEKEREMTK